MNFIVTQQIYSIISTNWQITDAIFTMEHFGFAPFINTTWKTVIKFLDKVNLNVSPDILQHFPQLLQVYGSSLHFLPLHVPPHLLNDVHDRTLGRPV